MHINSENYETYFIDFIDGTLSPSKEEELRRFLANNPALAEELNGLQSAVLEPTNTHYPNKHSVYKDAMPSGIESRFDYLCIAKLENDITTLETQELETVLKHSVVETESYVLFQKTKLIPDTSIRYAKKVALKRYGFLNLSYRHLIGFVSTAAASAAILLGILFFLPKTFEHSPLQMASNIRTQPENTILLNPISIKKISLPETKADIDIKALGTSKPLPISANVTTPEQVEDNSELKEPRQDITIAKLSSIELTSISYNSDNHIYIIYNELLALNNSAAEISEQSSSGNRSFGLFELAQMGVNRLARLSERDISLTKETDVNGYIKKINFSSRFFAVSVPVKHER